MFVRNLFVREEPDTLVIGAGVRPEWLQAGTEFGPTLTPYGSVSVRFEAKNSVVLVKLVATWRTGAAPALELRVPGCVPQQLKAGEPGNEFIIQLVSSTEQPAAPTVPPITP
jgi:hypothetical protein